ncbi:MAG: transporter, partial [Haloplasmataceae bacterium]|nr:transporter [Haloplasmataceae bacterium]
MQSKMQKYLILALGLIMSAYSVNSILRPNGIMTGGITGLSRVFEYIIKTNDFLNFIDDRYIYNIIYYALAIIVVLVAYTLLGKDDAIKIIFMSVVYPLILFLFTYLQIPPLKFTYIIGNQEVNDIFLAAIFYGVIAGIANGLFIRIGFTSGGSDTIAKIIYRRLLPFVSLGKILMFVDGLFILSSLFVFDMRITAYAFVTKFVYMKSIDMIVFGIGTKRVKMEILSTKYDEISKYILNSVNRGVTLVDTEGGYSHLKLRQIITICSPRESIIIKNYIASIDEKAFVYLIP